MEVQGQDQSKKIRMLCECDGWCINRIEVPVEDFIYVNNHANWYMRSKNCVNVRGKPVEDRPDSDYIVYQHPWRVNPLGLPNNAKFSRAYNLVIFREFIYRSQMEDTNGAKDV